MKIRILKGHEEEAQYRDQVIAEYTNNPLIEALPSIMSQEETVRLIGNYPAFSANEKNLPAFQKMHLLGRLNRLVQPLFRHVELEQAISRAIRQGYIARRVLDPDYTRRKREDNPLRPQIALTGMRSSASSFSLVGVSGVGKSTAVERILLTYPQVIRHYRYKGSNFPFTQIVWLKVECPHDGSLRSLSTFLLQGIDDVLGTNYQQQYASGRKGTNEILTAFAKLATIHGIGILVIDEIQNLCKCESHGQDEMLNYFVQLVNQLGLPVLLIGTPKADILLKTQLREARRACGEGAFYWDRLDSKDEWPHIVRSLWKYQWTTGHCGLNQQLSDLLYDESQGITDIAVKLYMLSQWRAINDGKPMINDLIIRQVLRDYMRPIKPMLDALKSKDVSLIKTYHDLPIEWNSIYQNAGLTGVVSGDKSLLELGRDKVKDITSAMVDYLLQSGVSQQDAHTAVSTVLKNAKHENIKQLNAQAIQLAFELQGKK